MKNLILKDDGYAMVIALSFITGLALLAGIIVAVSTSEKKTAFNEYTYSRSFYSADAGGESAINWLRIQNRPPTELDTLSHVYVPAGMDTLNSDALFRHDITYAGKQLRPGWDINLYKDYRYTIESQGQSVAESEAEIELRALRLFKEGY